MLAESTGESNRQNARKSVAQASSRTGLGGNLCTNDTKEFFGGDFALLDLRAAPIRHGLELGGLGNALYGVARLDQFSDRLGDLQDFEDARPSPVARVVTLLTSFSPVEPFCRFRELDGFE